MQLFRANATIFFFKLNFFFAPQNIEKLPYKVAHNPTRPGILVQQVFGFVELRQFCTLFLLIFEVDKLCRVNLEMHHSKPLPSILSGFTYTLSV